MVYLITGKKNSGKTTYAKRLVKELEEEGNKVLWLDGDELRNETGNNDFTPKGRYGNLMLAASRAQKAEREGKIVVLSFVAPLKAWRNSMRCYFKHSHTVYIPGGELWEGSTYEVPDIKELCMSIRGRKLVIDGLWAEVITHE